MVVEEPEAGIIVFSTVYGINCISNCVSSIGNSEAITRISIYSHLHYPLHTTPTWYHQCQWRGSGTKALITSRAISLGKLKRVVHLVVANQGAVHLLGGQNMYSVIFGIGAPSIKLKKQVERG